MRRATLVGPDRPEPAVRSAGGTRERRPDRGLEHLQRTAGNAAVAAIVRDVEALATRRDAEVPLPTATVQRRGRIDTVPVAGPPDAVLIARIKREIEEEQSASRENNAALAAIRDALAEVEWTTPWTAAEVAILTDRIIVPLNAMREPRPVIEAAAGTQVMDAPGRDAADIVTQLITKWNTTSVSTREAGTKKDHFVTYQVKSNRIDREAKTQQDGVVYAYYRLQIGTKTYGGLLLQVDTTFPLDRVREAWWASVRGRHAIRLRMQQP